MIKNEKIIYPDNYVVFDFETTGLNTEDSRILEIGAIKVVNFEIIDRFECLILQDKPIPEIITKITNIKDEEILENGKTQDEAILEFMKFIYGENLIGHNIVRFDLPFLEMELNKRTENNKEYIEKFVNNMKNRIIDTAAIFKAEKLRLNRNWDESLYDFQLRVLNIAVQGIKYNISLCCEELEINNSNGQHRAMADVLLTNEIYKKIIK